MKKSNAPAAAEPVSVKIHRNSGAAPAPLVAQLMAGQTLPFEVTVTHNHLRPLTVPSSGLSTVLEPAKQHTVKVKSADQAWLLVTDLAEFAHMANNDNDDFAVIVAPGVVPAAETAAAPAINEEAAQ